MSNSVWPHRRQPNRLPHPWDSPGKNTKTGCHFLLQCMKVKSESKVAQSVQLLVTPWTAAYQAPPSMRFSRQEYWNGVPLPSPYLSTDTDIHSRVFVLKILIKPNLCLSQGSYFWNINYVNEYWKPSSHSAYLSKINEFPNENNTLLGKKLHCHLI